ncbi:hypothetical protein LXL04_004267 [Taraxacum kok-saghyz]
MAKRKELRDFTEGRWWADGAINGESNGEEESEGEQRYEKNGKDEPAWYPNIYGWPGDYDRPCSTFDTSKLFINLTAIANRMITRRIIMNNDFMINPELEVSHKFPETHPHSADFDAVPALAITTTVDLGKNPVQTKRIRFLINKLNRGPTSLVPTTREPFIRFRPTV